jgi:hypothetical protein
MAELTLLLPPALGLDGPIDVETIMPNGLADYARHCDWTLARAQARSGDRIAIAAYLGRGDRFDRAVADFAAAYADVNQRDHKTLLEAITAGRVEAVEGIKLIDSSA